MKNNPEMLPCRFCKNTEPRAREECDEIIVECQNCEASAWLDIWNSRTQPSVQGGGEGEGRWRSMESAPKDGGDKLDMLLYCPNLGVSGPCVVCYWQNAWIVSCTGNILQGHPTMWAPVPALTTGEKGE